MLKTKDSDFFFLKRTDNVKEYARQILTKLKTKQGVWKIRHLLIG